MMMNWKRKVWKMIEKTSEVLNQAWFKSLEYHQKMTGTGYPNVKDILTSTPFHLTTNQKNRRR